jgi:hypothetical protein
MQLVPLQHGAAKKKKPPPPAVVLTRSEMICRKLGIEPAAAAAQLASIRPAVAVAAPAPAAVVPEADTPALACLLLLAGLSLHSPGVRLVTWAVILDCHQFNRVLPAK